MVNNYIVPRIQLFHQTRLSHSVSLHVSMVRLVPRLVQNRCELVVLLDRPGVQPRRLVFLPLVERDSFIVLFRKNVSQVGRPVIRLSVIIMGLVLEKRVVSVRTVSMEEQMIRINVV